VLHDLVRGLGAAGQSKGVAQPLESSLRRDLSGTEPPPERREFARRVRTSDVNAAVPKCEESMEHGVLEWRSVRSEATTYGL
jgi:hypothetical protein